MAASPGGARRCPSCGAEASEGEAACPHHGTSLNLATACPDSDGDATVFERTLLQVRVPDLPVPRGISSAAPSVPWSSESPSPPLELVRVAPLTEPPGAPEPDFGPTRPAYQAPAGLFHPELAKTVIRGSSGLSLPPAEEQTGMDEATLIPSQGPGGELRHGDRVGEYLVAERVGEGSMGIVYRALNPLIGKTVAIKVLKPEVASQPGQMERLLAEARTVNAIKHRGIIDIFGYGQLPDGRHYLVMEYLEGQRLDALIRAQAPLPLSEAIPLLEEILSALEAAHAARVIHRDLKPSNIFLVKPPRGPWYLKILDFGLAKQAETASGSASPTRQDLIVGTPDYMSPEQAHGERVGPFTDLYALGVLAFQLLTGKLPFSAKTPMEMILQHQGQPAPRPSSLNPAIPPLVDNLLLRLLAKSPSARPSSAAEVLEVLGRAKPALARPRERLGPWVAVAGALVLLAVSLLLAFQPAWKEAAAPGAVPQPRKPPAAVVAAPRVEPSRPPVPPPAELTPPRPVEPPSTPPRPSLEEKKSELLARISELRARVSRKKLLLPALNGLQAEAKAAKDLAALEKVALRLSRWERANMKK